MTAPNTLCGVLPSINTSPVNAKITSDTTNNLIKWFIVYSKCRLCLVVIVLTVDKFSVFAYGQSVCPNSLVGCN